MLVIFYIMPPDPNRPALPTDANHKVLMGGVSSSDGVTPVALEIDETTGGTLTRAVSSTYSALSADANTLGDNLIIDATAGQELRVYYICLSADGANAADVTATVKIGTDEPFKMSLKPGSMWARNIGAGHKYLAGNAGDNLVVDLSDAQTVYVSVEYEIITL